MSLCLFFSCVCSARSIRLGEFFITRHSTLSGARVVFHMVAAPRFLVVSFFVCFTISLVKVCSLHLLFVSLSLNHKFIFRQSFRRCSGDDGALGPKSALLRGLRNVLAVAAQYGVTSLALPVLLADRGALDTKNLGMLIVDCSFVPVRSVSICVLREGVETMMSDAAALKRAQTILFAVKSSLQHHCSGCGERAAAH